MHYVDMYTCRSDYCTKRVKAHHASKSTHTRGIVWRYQTTDGYSSYGTARIRNSNVVAGNARQYTNTYTCCGVTDHSKDSAAVHIASCIWCTMLCRKIQWMLNEQYTQYIQWGTGKEKYEWYQWWSKHWSICLFRKTIQHMNALLQKQTVLSIQYSGREGVNQSSQAGWIAVTKYSYAVACTHDPCMYCCSKILCFAMHIREWRGNEDSYIHLKHADSNASLVRFALNLALSLQGCHLHMHVHTYMAIYTYTQSHVHNYAIAYRYAVPSVTNWCIAKVQASAPTVSSYGSQYTMAKLEEHSSAAWLGSAMLCSKVLLLLKWSCYVNCLRKLTTCAQCSVDWWTIVTRPLIVM